MPDDLGDAERLSQILVDVAYFKKAHAQTGVGAQPPTVYADKYVTDVQFLLKLVDRIGTAAATSELPKTELERDLEHDAAGRTERRKPKT